MVSAENKVLQSRKLPILRIDARMLSLVLVVMGLFVSGYLSYVKATGVPMACTGGVFNCDAVQHSRYSELFGVPIAYLGFIVYWIIGGLIVFENKSNFMRENGMSILFGVVMFAWLYSMYLVYLQGFVLQAWCQWCLTHEAIITVLFIVTLWRLRKYFEATA